MSKLTIQNNNSEHGVENMHSNFSSSNSMLIESHPDIEDEQDRDQSHHTQFSIEDSNAKMNDEDKFSENHALILLPSKNLNDFPISIEELLNTFQKEKFLAQRKIYERPDIQREENYPPGINHEDTNTNLIIESKLKINLKEFSLSLDLGRNFITDITNTYPYFAWVTHLNLEYNQLTNIHLQLFPNIRVLNLEGNNIQMQTLSPLSSVSLTFLNLSKNPIVQIFSGQSITSHKNIITYVSELSRKLKGLQSLTELVLVDGHAEDKQETELNNNSYLKLLKDELINTLPELMRIDDTWIMEFTFSSAMQSDEGSAILNKQHSPPTLSNESNCISSNQLVDKESLSKNSKDKDLVTKAAALPSERNTETLEGNNSRITYSTVVDVEEDLVRFDESVTKIDFQNSQVSILHRPTRISYSELEQYATRLEAYENAIQNNFVSLIDIEQMNEFKFQLMSDYSVHQENQSIVQKQIYKISTILQRLQELEGDSERPQNLASIQLSTLQERDSISSNDEYNDIFNEIREIPFLRHLSQTYDNIVPPLKKLEKKLNLEYQIFDETKKNLDSMLQRIQRCIHNSHSVYTIQSQHSLLSLVVQSLKDKLGLSDQYLEKYSPFNEHSLSQMIANILSKERPNTPNVQLDTLQNEIEVAKSKMHDFDEATKKLNTVEMKNQQLELELSNLRKQLHEVKNVSLDISTQLDSERNKCKNSQIEIQRYASELQDADNRYLTLKSDFDSLNEKYTKLKQENIELKSSSSNFELLSDENDRNKDLGTLRKEFSSLMNDVHHARELARIEQEKYEICTVAHKNLLSEVRDMEIQKEKAEEEISQLKYKIEETRSKNIQESKNLEKIKADYAATHENLQYLQKQIIELETALKSKTQNLDPIRREISLLVQKKEELKKQVAEIHAKCLSKESTLSTLSEECHKLEDIIEERTKKCKELSLNIQSFKHELQETKNSNRSILSKMESNSNELLTIRNDLEKLQMEKSHLQESIHLVQERKQLIEEQMQEMINLVRSAKEEMESTSKVREENMSFFQELESIHKKIELAQAQLKQTEADQKAVIDERDSLKKEIQALQLAMQSLVEEDWQREVLEKLKEVRSRCNTSGDVNDLELIISSKEEYQGLKSKISHLQNEVSLLEDEKANQMMKRRSLEIELEELKATNNIYAQRANVQSQSQQDIILSLKKSISTLQDEIEEYKEKVKSQDKKYIVLNEEYEKLKSSNQVSAEELKNKVSQLFALQTMNKKQQKEIATLQKKLRKENKSSPNRYVLPDYTMQSQLHLKDLKIQQLQQECNRLLSAQHEMFNSNPTLTSIFEHFQKEYQRLCTEYFSTIQSQNSDLETYKYALLQKEESYKMQIQVLQEQIQNKEKQNSTRIDAMEKEIEYIWKLKSSKDEEDVYNIYQEEAEQYLEELKALCIQHDEQGSYIRDLLDTIQKKDDYILELISKGKHQREQMERKSFQEQAFLQQCEKFRMLHRSENCSSSSTQTYRDLQESGTQITIEKKEADVQVDSSPLSTAKSTTMTSEHPNLMKNFDILRADENNSYSSDTSDDEDTTDNEHTSTSDFSTRAPSRFESKEETVPYLKDVVQTLTSVLKEKNIYIQDLENEFCKVQDLLEKVYVNMDSKLDKEVQCSISTSDYSLRHLSVKMLVRILKRESLKLLSLEPRKQTTLSLLLDHFQECYIKEKSRVKALKDSNLKKCKEVTTEGGQYISSSQNYREKNFLSPTFNIIRSETSQESLEGREIPQKRENRSYNRIVGMMKSENHNKHAERRKSSSPWKSESFQLKDKELSARVRRLLTSSESNSNFSSDCSSDESEELLNSLKEDIQIMNENLTKQRNSFHSIEKKLHHK